MTDRVIVAKITRVGMRAMFAASQSGLQLKLKYMAIGTAADVGYVPTGAETALKTEFQRVAIGGGDYVGDFEIIVQALLDGSPAGWVGEVGIFDENGVLFALWSEPKNPIAYKAPGVAFVLAMTLAVSEIPPNALTIVAGGPSVNLVLGGPLTDFALAITQLQGRALTQDVRVETAAILQTYR